MEELQGKKLINLTGLQAFWNNVVIPRFNETDNNVNNVNDLVSEVERNLEEQISAKAALSDFEALSQTVAGKADTSALDALSQTVAGKADSSVVAGITERFDKFNGGEDTIEEVITNIETIAATAGVTSVKGGDGADDLVQITVAGTKPEDSDIYQGNVIISIDDAKLLAALDTKAAQGDLEAAVGRITTAEGKITTAEGKITALEGAVDGKADKTALKAAEDRITTAEGKITTLEGDVDGKAAQSDLEAAVGRIDTAEGKITAAEGKITTLEGAVNALSSATDFIGVTTTEISDGSEITQIVINGENYTAVKGDIVIGDGTSKEFIWDGGKWLELGDTTGLAQKVTALEGVVNGKASQGDLDAAVGRIDTAEGKITALEEAVDAIIPLTAEEVTDAFNDAWEPDVN